MSGQGRVGATNRELTFENLFTPNTPTRRNYEEWMRAFHSFSSRFISGKFACIQREAKQAVADCPTHYQKGVEVICERALIQARSFARAMKLYRNEIANAGGESVSFTTCLERDADALCSDIGLFAWRKHAGFQLPKFCQPLVKAGVLEPQSVTAFVNRLCSDNCHARIQSSIRRYQQMMQPLLQRIDVVVMPCTDVAWQRKRKTRLRALSLASKQLRAVQQLHNPLLTEKQRERDSLQQQLAAWQTRRANEAALVAREKQEAEAQREIDRQYAEEQQQRQEAARVRADQRSSITADVRHQSSFLSTTAPEGLIREEIETVYERWLASHTQWDLPDPD